MHLLGLSQNHMSQGLVLKNLTVDYRNALKQRAQFCTDCAGTSNRS